MLAELLEDTGCPPVHTNEQLEEFNSLYASGKLDEALRTADALLNKSMLPIAEALAQRECFMTANRSVNLAMPRVICIVGSPRSGTSLVYNLLCKITGFAFFSNHSHHLWTTFSIAGRRAVPWWSQLDSPFEHRIDDVKYAKNWLVATECEHILQRAIPLYRHLGGHRFELRRPRVADAEMLRHAIAQHADLFGATTAIIKSPFNSFRLQELQTILGDALGPVIVVDRSESDAASSMSRNGFEYLDEGMRTLTSREAFRRHHTAIEDSGLPFHRIRLEDLLQDPQAECVSLLTALSIETTADLRSVTLGIQS